MLRHAALALMLLLTALGQTAAAADGSVARARGLLQTGDLKGATNAVKNALQEDPGNADARLLLGDIYLKVGDGAAAERELRRAQELGVDPSRWRLPLAKALILQGKYADALARLEGAADLPPAEQAGVWAQRGYAQLGLGRTEAAQASFDTALRFDPDEAAATVGLIRLALEAGEEARAGRLTDEHLERHPDDVDALLIRCELLRKAGKLGDAAQEFARVMELDPGDVRGYLGHATAMIGLQRFEEAVHDLDAAEGLQPAAPMVHYLRGVIAFQQQKWDQADEYVEKVLAAVPNHLPSKLLLGIIRYAQDDFEVAAEYLGTVVSAMPENIQARKVLGAARIKMREPAKAVEVLLPAAGSDDPHLLALLGSAYMVQGDQDRGQGWLNRAVELAPDVAALRTQLALSLLATGKADKAVEELQSAVDLAQDTLQADVLLVLAHLKDGRVDEALKTSRNLEQRRPDDPISYNLTGLALLAKGDEKGAAERFNKALAVDPGFISAEINLARIEFASNDLDAAEARYLRVLNKAPAHLDAMLGLAALAERRGDADELVRRLEAAQDANPTATQPGLLLTRFYIARGDYLKALAITTDLAARAPGNASIQQMLAQTQTLAGQVPDAIRTLDQLSAANPTDPQTPYLAGAAHWTAGNYQAAADAFRRAIALKPDFADARVALASVLMLARQYERALDVAGGLQHDLPTSPLGFRIEGAILTQAGRHAEAVSALEHAVKLANDGDVTRQLADAYAKAGRADDGIRLLEGWLDTHPDNRPAMGMLVIAYQTGGQDAKALKLYERLYEADKDNPALLNNMAWLYHKTGDPRAEAMARQAYEAAPNRPAIADTYGWILFSVGQKDRGLSILQQAYLGDPTQAEIGYHVAVAMSEMGRPDEAVKILRKILRDNPNFPQVKESRALLEKLGG